MNPTFKMSTNDWSAFERRYNKRHEQIVHEENIRRAIGCVEDAIKSARAGERRLDCLTDALNSLRGALRCVEWEDEQEK